MKYLVLGAGMMGRAVADDLVRSSAAHEVLLGDIDEASAARAAAQLGPKVLPLRLDVNSNADLREAVSEVQVVVSAISYNANLAVTHAAIDCGVHMCDLGGNDTVVRQQGALDERARRAGVTIVPNCGLAPGLADILAMHAFHQFDQVDTLTLRVGGLPQHPRPPLEYQIVFSVEGLLNEYTERVVTIRDGLKQTVEPLADLEPIEFQPPFGVLEAFNTSGGLSCLADILQGKVRTLDYKTIRYPGHAAKFKTLLDLGFASSEPVLAGSTLRTARELFTELLKRKLDYGDKDVVLLRVAAHGVSAGRTGTLVYEMIDWYDENTHTSAMMRTTAFPTSIVAQMLAKGLITSRGVLPAERCVPAEPMIRALAERNITITEART